MDSKGQHEHYMKRCIALGIQAKQRGDAPVGALLAAGGRILSEGVEGGKTNKDITCHAEIEAIRNLIKDTGATDLSHCTLYTTHEPCIMCSYVIRHHKINMVVWGISTGMFGGASSACKLLEDRSITTWSAPPVLLSGILEQACREQLYDRDA